MEEFDSGVAPITFVRKGQRWIIDTWGVPVKTESKIHTTESLLLHDTNVYTAHREGEPHHQVKFYYLEQDRMFEEITSSIRFGNVTATAPPILKLTNIKDAKQKPLPPNPNAMTMAPKIPVQLNSFKGTPHSNLVNLCYLSAQMTPNGFGDLSFLTSEEQTLHRPPEYLRGMRDLMWSLMTPAMQTKLRTLPPQQTLLKDNHITHVYHHIFSK